MKIKYIGPRRVDLEHGKIYDAIIVKDSNMFYGIQETEEDAYAYPKSFFEVVEED